MKTHQQAQRRITETSDNFDYVPGQKQKKKTETSDNFGQKQKKKTEMSDNFDYVPGQKQKKKTETSDNFDYVPGQKQKKKTEISDNFDYVPGQKQKKKTETSDNFGQKHHNREMDKQWEQHDQTWWQYTTQALLTVLRALCVPVLFFFSLLRWFVLDGHFLDIGRWVKKGDLCWQPPRSGEWQGFIQTARSDAKLLVILIAVIAITFLDVQRQTIPPSE